MSLAPTFDELLENSTSLKAAMYEVTFALQTLNDYLDKGMSWC